MQRRLIQDDVNRLRDRLMLMGGACEKAIMLAMRALGERNTDLADRVIREDDIIDQMELEIDQMCVDILVLKQPAASDLRFVVSVARTAPMIERIADHAVNIAKHALALNEEPPLNFGDDPYRMGTIVQEILVDALDAFIEGEPDKARAVIERDDQVDGLYDECYNEIIMRMGSEPGIVGRGARWLYVIKHLERIADYATNVCEQVTYVARGQVIKHRVW
ncbi:MAG TPA: phosphate signaling complex protein PhoU [Blastocatellia bacterium]|nr:phosphate signaling complex protein PhoU [Blastocatellia bacterium]